MVGLQPMMASAQRLQILGNRQATRLGMLVVERLDVIDIAAMGRHTTTGEDAVLIAGNYLPFGIGRRPVGGRILTLFRGPAAQSGRSSGRRGS